MRRKALEAIAEADLLLLVVDGAAGVAPGDRQAAEAARQSGVATVVVANKVDRKESEAGELEAWELGFPEVLGVSAEHGIGVDDVLAAVASRMPAAAEEAEPAAPEEAPEPPEIAIAVVGRPNVGKSSIVERAPRLRAVHRLRDRRHDARRRGHAPRAPGPEAAPRRHGRHPPARGARSRVPRCSSVVHARQRIEQCDVAILVMDAAEGPTAQDATVASYADDAGKGLVLVANKWDLATRPGKEGGEVAKAIRAEIERQIPFARHAPVLLVSAKIGARRREGPGDGRPGRREPAAAHLDGGAEPRPRTGAPGQGAADGLRQDAARPLRRPDGDRSADFRARRRAGEERLHFSEERRIENLLREAADFSGSPIRIEVRQRSGEERGEKKRSRRFQAACGLHEGPQVALE